MVSQKHSNQFLNPPECVTNFPKAYTLTQYLGAPGTQTPYFCLFVVVVVVFFVCVCSFLDFFLLKYALTQAQVIKVF